MQRVGAGASCAGAGPGQCLDSDIITVNLGSPNFSRLPDGGWLCGSGGSGVSAIASPGAGADTCTPAQAAAGNWLPL